MIVESFCNFVFGGHADFFKIVEIGEILLLDFSPKPTGIGFAIRDGIDVEFGSENQIKLKISANDEIEATVEFKTVISGRSSEKDQEITLKKGINEIIIDIPQALSSPLKEIVIFFPRNGREDSINISFLEIELIKKTEIKTLNMNAVVKIKLTQVGIDRLKHIHEEIYEKHPDCKPDFNPPEVDEEGFCEMLLWKVMNYFGDLCDFCTEDFPFELNIKICDNQFE